MQKIDLLSINQTNLYGHSKIFNQFVNLYEKKKLPKKIILSGPKGIGKCTLAYHLINYIFSKDEENNYDIEHLKINALNKSFNLTINNSHPNLHLVDVIENKKNIEINQIREMISFCNKSSFNNNEKVILIDNVDKLNKNSVNALLKVIEEPNNSILFILILDSNKQTLSTLKSRCIKFKLFLSFKDSLNTINKITESNISNLISNDLINHYCSPGHYVKLINFAIRNEIHLENIDLKSFLLLLINNSFYKKDIFIKEAIFQYIEFYFLKMINKNNLYQMNYNYKRFIEKVHNMNTYNLDQESFFIDIKKSIFNG